MRPIIPATYAGFGIELKALTQADLPLLMAGRNDHAVLSFMDDTRPVNLAVLEYWLKKTERYGSTFPFIAFFQNEPVAYVDVRNCDFRKGVCEDGIFLYHQQYFGKNIGSRIWLCREKLLRALNIRDVISRMKPQNGRSIRFFQKMGAKYDRTENGFLVYRQSFQDRIKALEQVAMQLDMQPEFEKIYGSLG